MHTSHGWATNESRELFLRQVGFFGHLLLRQQQQSHRSYKIEVVSATFVFFMCFSVIALFSPSIAVLAPLNNFTTSQSTVLIALPTVSSEEHKVVFLFSDYHSDHSNVDAHPAVNFFN
jgi:hypothetical protein